MAKKALSQHQKNFLKVSKDAKALYATGKFKKYTDAVSKAWKNFQK